MNDAWLIIGIFVFAFILWLSTGGPTRPISFAGPYITPITDVGDDQEGYGQDLNWNGSEDGVWSLRSILGRFEGKLSSEDIGIVSPLEGRVSIASGASGPSATEAAREYVTIRADRDGEAVDVAGWRLVSAKSGAEAVIPAGVVLGPDEEAIIATGKSPLGYDFRENKCIGYLDEDRSVIPSLPRSCPSPVDELGEFYAGSASSYDACRNFVSSIPRCSTPDSIPREASGNCEAFVRERLNYRGCVVAHQADADFAGDTWRVYQDRERELWRSDNEIIKLLDREGKTVDIYSY